MCILYFCSLLDADIPELTATLGGSTGSEQVETFQRSFLIFKSYFPWFKVHASALNLWLFSRVLTDLILTVFCLFFNISDISPRKCEPGAADPAMLLMLIFGKFFKHHHGWEGSLGSRFRLREQHTGSWLTCAPASTPAQEKEVAGLGTRGAWGAPQL